MSLDNVRQLSLNAGVLSTSVRRDETGSAPTETRSLNRPHPNHEGGGLVDIVPAAKPSATPPPESRVDGCPECVVNTEAPSSVTSSAQGFIANYVCHDCDYSWSTSWKD